MTIAKDIIRNDGSLSLNDFKPIAINYSKNNHRAGNTQVYHRVFENAINILGNKALMEINTLDIEEFKNIRSQSVKKTTVNIELRTLKAILNLAVKWNYIKTNPAKNVKQFKISEKELDFISENEMTTLLENIDDLKYRLLVKTAYYTGMRLNEILNLQWKDIGFTEMLIKVRNKEDFETKSGKNRTIPLSSKLSEGLILYKASLVRDEIYNDDNYVFSNRKRKRYDKHYISRTFKKFIRKAKLNDHYHFHSLRHTCFSTLAKKGIGIYDIKEIAGHSSIRTTEIYLHTCTESLRKAIEKL
ncbi:site-specific integrase [Flavobacterium filum]|uniref:tyrosine-type recombinase/integrase n=1 Tax=Flavobacterium filum TaxID=370974 RepID=UPI0023F46E1A|nr:site-specific integrase [Flavobacterium filum]